MGMHVDWQGLVHYLTRDPVPQTVFGMKRRGEPFPKNPTQMCELIWQIKQASMQGWSSNGIPVERLERLFVVYDAPTNAAKAMRSNDLQSFRSEYSKHWTQIIQKQASAISDVDQFDAMLASVSLWLSQDLLASEAGEDLWPVSFSLTSQPSPTIVDGMQVVLKRVNVHLEIQSGDRIWHEIYPRALEAQDGEVTLRKIGDNERPGRSITSKHDCYIEDVCPPHDLYRVAGLNKGDRVRVWVEAVSKDLGLEPREDLADAAAAIEEDEKSIERDPPASFARYRPNGITDLTSIEQKHLLKIIEEKRRMLITRSDQPRPSEGYIVLDSAVRVSPYGTSDEGGSDDTNS